MLENPLEIIWYFIAVQEIGGNDFIFEFLDTIRSKTSLHFITQPVKSTYLTSFFLLPLPLRFVSSNRILTPSTSISLSHFGNVISFSGCFRSSSLTLITRKNFSSPWISFSSLERESRLPKCFYSASILLKYRSLRPQRIEPERETGPVVTSVLREDRSTLVNFG